MLMVGQVLYGFCSGYFGRDHHHDSRVEAVGVDWVVVRRVDDVHAEPEFACGKIIHEELAPSLDPNF